MSLDISKKDISIRDQWARCHAIEGVQTEWNKLVGRQAPGKNAQLLDGDTLPKAPTPPIPKGPFDPPKIVRLGIVGAGAAGLFTAMVLDYLNFQLFLAELGQEKGSGVKLPTGDNPFSEDDPFDWDGLFKRPSRLRFQYEILEANPSERLGGRLFTYDFGGPRDTHDYYDVGAMRFPDNRVMTRTFDLFTKLGMKKEDLKTNPNAQDGSLIPYYMNNGAGLTFAEPWCYNDITLWGDTYNAVSSQSINNDPFGFSINGSIPQNILKHSPGDIMNAAIEPFREALKKDIETTPPGRSGWNLLMKYDNFSTRQFLSTKPPVPLPPGPIPPPPYDYDTIEWMETFNGGTNWYDQAHSETVLESLDFEYDDKTNWYCILGGTKQLAKKMEAKIYRKPIYNSRVTAIKAIGTLKVEVDVETSSAKSTKAYNAVINTTTLGCLGHMDLSEAGLNPGTKQAIRSLGYGPSAKVAIKFKRAWWIHDLGKYNITMGGLGHSDLNIRTCVYPSYNIYDAETKTAVLLVSYTWQQDALRLASLMSKNPDHNQKVKDEANLKELLFRELVRLHKNDDITDEKLYTLISENYLDHYAHDWSEDPSTAGAFAFFRPQQFSSMWNRLIQPSGDVVIVGEAASPHHAWVVGALESVIHGLYSWMGLNVGYIPEFKVAMKILEKAKEGNPFVGLPPYMESNTSLWDSVLGMFNRAEHLEHWQKEHLGKEQPKGVEVDSIASLFAQLDLKTDLKQ